MADINVGELEATLRLRDELSAKLKDVDATIAKMGTTVDGVSQKVSAFSVAGQIASKTWADVKTQLAVTIAGFVSAQAIINAVSFAWRTFTGFVSSSIESAEAAEQAQAKLTQALIQQGQKLPEVISQYNDLAAQFQQTTVFGDDLITEMEALLVQVGGVMPAQMENALTAATDLASGLGIELPQATMLLAKAFAGGGDELGRLKAILGDTIHEGASMVDVMAAINQKFGGQAQADASTYAGEVAKLANEWDNFKEEIGGVLVQSDELKQFIRDLGKFLVAATKDLKQFIHEMSILKQTLTAIGQLGGGQSPFVKMVEGAKDLPKVADEATAALHGNKLAIEARALAGNRFAVAMVEEKYVIEEANKAHAAAVKAAKEHEAAIKKADQASQQFRDSVTKLGTATGIWIGLMPGLKSGFTSIVNAGIEAESALGGLSAQFGVLHGRAVGLEPDLYSVAGAIKAVEDATKTIPVTMADLAKPTLWDGFLKGAESVMQQLPGVILKAIQGGGNIGQTIGAFLGASIGKSIGKALSEAMPNAFGKALGSIIPVVGEFAGLFVGKLIDKWFGPSEREKVIHMRRELLGAGLEVTEFEKRAISAGVSLDKLWKSDNVKGYEREVNKATLAIEAFEARIAGVTKAAEGLTLRAQGFAMPFEKPLAELAELRAGLPALEKDLADAMTGGKGTELEILNAEKAVTSAKGAISAIQAELQKAKAKGDTGLVATLSGDLKIAQLEADELVKKLEILKTGADPAAISKAQAALDLANANIALITGNLDVLKTQGSGAFERIGAMAVNQFGIILSQTGDLNQAFAAVGPALDILVGLQKELGFEASGAVQSLLGLRQVATTNQDITDSVAGITLMMKELGKVGLVNQVTFDNFGADAVGLFDQMKSRGVSAKDSLLLMQPALQQLWQLQKDFGFVTDEATQNLIDMGVENGIVGTDFQTEGQKMYEIMVEIKDILIIVGDTLKKGIGGSLETVGSELTESKGDFKSWSSTAVAEAGEVSAAVDTVTFGSSPGGIKEWKPRIMEAADAMKTFRDVAERELDGVARSVNAMGDSVRFLKNDLDALGLTGEDIDRIRRTDPGALSRLAREAAEMERQKKAMRTAGTRRTGEGPTPVGDVNYPWQPVPGEIKSGRNVSMSQQNEITVNMTGVDPFDQRDLDDKMRRIALPILIDALDKDYGRSRQNMLKALRLD